MVKANDMNCKVKNNETTITLGVGDVLQQLISKFAY